MEQTILESLKGLEGSVVKGTNASAYLTFDFSGSVKIERGAFSMLIHFYSKLSESKHKGVISIDDWDVNDTEDYNLNGLPIDNITSFKAKLTDWGVGSLGNKLKFTSEEEKTAICMAILDNDELKKVFGKKFKIWDILSIDEKMLLDLQYVVDNFKSCGDYLKGNVSKHYKIIEVKENTYPTLEEYQAKLVELTK
jgi:hypothetical protein